MLHSRTQSNQKSSEQADSLSLQQIARTLNTIAEGWRIAAREGTLARKRRDETYRKEKIVNLSSYFASVRQLPFLGSQVVGRR